MALDPVTLAQLQAQLAQVNVVIASGLESASVEGNNSSFRSLEELYKIRDDLMNQLGVTNNNRRRRTVAAYNGGFYPGTGY